MLDPKLVRENPQAVKDAARVKRVGSAELVEQWLAADERRRGAQGRADTVRAEQGGLGKYVGRLKNPKTAAQAVEELKTAVPAAGGAIAERVAGGKAEAEAAAEWVLAESGRLKEQYEGELAVQAEAERVAQEIMLQLPAIPDPAWPVGRDAEENVVVRTWADPARPAVKIEGGRKDHVALGKDLRILDFERGVKLAGSRSYVVRGAGALLYNAVLRFAQDVLVKRGYEMFVVPVLVTEQCMVGTGYFPAGKEQAYVTQDNGVLVGTSEVPLASFHGGEILDEGEMPKRFAALSTCFRREAGAAGKDTAGLYRVHQFDKVEQVIVHKADEAEHVALHEEIIRNAEDILQALKLPYRVVQNCTGDMGQGKWRMYDIETWMPSRNGYGETHSGSALKDFQARRLNLRYKTKVETGKSETKFCYTLNNTAIACPRVLIAILEQYQDGQGGVEVPEVLRGYMGGVERIS
ncbi:MAG TPA: serine--tRNA ligase [Tepidisphaeraceae bacterium]|nr:serine--tRNA ligase [Tepidisphaeraceae bacterium]